MAAYPSDLTDREWEIIKKEVLKERRGGRHRSVNVREILNAIFCVLDNGTKWRSLPHDYPKWQTVYWYFNQWNRNGTVEKIHRKLRKITRVLAGRKPDETVGIIDSQSTITTEEGEKISIGFDAGKKQKEEKGISWLRRLDYSLKHWCTQRVFRIVMEGITPQQSKDEWSNTSKRIC